MIASTPSVDPVQRLLRVVWAELRQRDAPARRTRARLTVGALLLALLASCAGPHPRPAFGAWLLAGLLVWALPGALLVRRLTGSVLIEIGARGVRHVSTRKLPVRARLAQVLLGSALGLALAGYLALAVGSLGPRCIDAARVVAFLSVAQLVPLRPFALGRFIGERLSPRLAVAHAVLSCLVVGVAVWAFSRLLQQPAGLVGFSLWVVLAMLELLESLARFADAKLEPESRLAAVDALTLEDQPRRALGLAEQLLLSARSREVRSQAQLRVAWAAIGAGDRESALVALAQLPEELLGAHLLAAYLTIAGDEARAIALLEAAQRHGIHSRQSTQLLADLYHRVDNPVALVALTASAREMFEDDDVARIQAALVASHPGARDSASRLGALPLQGLLQRAQPLVAGGR